MGLCTPYVDSAEGRKTICTSATRPTGANVWPGKEIFETDTSRSWIYTSGATWALTHWASTAGRPGVILTDAAQSFTSGVIADITWGTEVSDVDGWTSGGSATLTVPTGWGGRYIVTLSAGWASVPGTSASLSGVVNGSYTDGATCSSDISATTLTMVRTFAAGNTLKFQARQNSGGAINLVSRLEVAWLGV